MKKIVLTLTILLSFAAADALARDAKSAVTDRDGNVVRNILTKNCVRHDFNDGLDPCAPPAPEPAPVVVPEPEPEPEPVAQLTKEELTVYFNFNKSTVRPEGVVKLNNLIQALAASKGVESLSIVGYADRIGSTDYNLKLSKKRTTAVQSYLDSKVDIPTSILTVDSRGEANSVTSCEKQKGRKNLISCLAADRRVEIVLNYLK